MAQNPASPAKIDLQKFLNDPSYQNDREFMESFFDHMVEKRTKEAKERADRETPPEPENFFDRLFRTRP